MNITSDCFRPLVPLLCVLGSALAPVTAAPGTQSGPIAMPPNGSVVVAVDSTHDTLTFYDPATGALTGAVDVGFTPVSVAVNNDFAYVANQGSNNVSVVSLATRAVVATIPVGREPTQIALSPNGTRLFVWVRGDRLLTVVNTTTNTPITSRAIGSQVEGLAVTNDGDGDDLDESIVWAKTKKYGFDSSGNFPQDEGQDTNRLAHISSATSANLDPLTETDLEPVTDTGFNANGKSAPANLSGSPPTPAVASTNPQTFTTATGAFPNLLGAVAIHPVNGLGYVVSTGASPNGPLRFDSNNQGLVSVVNLTTGAEVFIPQTDPLLRQTAPLNLNQGVNLATTPSPRLFFANPVAMAWRPDGSDAWVVNQNTNCLVRVTVDANGAPTIGAPLVAGPSSIVRVDLEAVGAGQIAGKGANGIVINPAGTRAFVSCDISRSVTMVDISNATAPAILATAQSAPLPATGTQAALALRGEELFNSARGRMSSEGWGSCSSCHPGGYSDNVTWMFPDGPRQTPSLAGSFAKGNTADRRIFNWSAVNDEVADFERNIRSVSGGEGAIEDDRRILAIGGAAAGGDTGGIEQFHQFTGAVSATNDLAGGATFPALLVRRDHASATLPDGRVFIFGGRTGAGAGTLVTGADLVVEFDPRANTVRSCNAAGFTPRHSCSAAVVQTSEGSRICVLGGFPDTPNTTLPVETVEEFNPLTETWRTCASMPQAVAEAACCTAGGINTNEPLELIHMFSGNKGTEAAPSLLSGSAPAFNLQRFQPDPAGPGTWTTFNLTGMTARRGHGMANIVKETISRIYTFGGYNSAGTLLATVQEYGAQGGISFSGFAKTNMPSARAHFGIHAAQTSSQIYIVGGMDVSGNPTGDIFEFSANNNGPVAGSVGSPTGSWVNGGTLTTPRHSLALSAPRSIRPLLPHGNDGLSDDWDAIEAYIKTIRARPAPVAADDPAAVAGRTLFEQTGLVQTGFSCATCHGGPRWTRSTVDFSSPPSASSTTGLGDERVLGLELRQTLTQPSNSATVNVGTYTTTGRVNEIRPSGADIRTNNPALGSTGYNIPSLLDVHATAPYFHHGIAQTLDDVLNGTWDGNGGMRHHFVNNATQRADLIAFLSSIDDTTAPVTFSSAATAVVTGMAIDAPNHVFQLSAIGTPNQVYTVEKSADLVNWQTHRSYNAGAAGAFTMFDFYFIHLFPRQFYRIGVR